MKTLLKIFVGLVSVVLFSSCITYQYVSLASNIPVTDKSEFLVENDSLRIIYSFHGEGGPIHMEIFNKLNKQFSVDWSKSALIKNGQSFSLWRDEARLNGTATEYNIIPQNEIINSVSNIEGKIVKKDKVTFIPPQSKIVVNSYTLNRAYFTIPDQTGQMMVFNTTEGETKARKFSFSKDDSPLNFRIFLSLSLDDSFQTPIQIDNSFWVSDFLTTSISPKAFDIYLGNQFYNMK